MAEEAKDFRISKFKHIFEILKSYQDSSGGMEAGFVAKRSWTDYLVFSRSHTCFRVFELGMNVMAVVSALLALYFAASQINFSFDMVLWNYEPKYRVYRVFVGMELCFCLQIILNFFTEYVDEHTQLAVRNLTLIVKRYLTKDFFLELIAVVPFNQLLRSAPGTPPFARGQYYDYSNLFYLIKLLRIRQVMKVLSPKYFTEFVQKTFAAQRQALIDKVEKQGITLDSLTDHNKIIEQMTLIYVF